MMPGEESKVKSQHVGLSFRLSRERNKRLNVSTIWMKMNVIVLTSLVWSLSWGPHYSFSKEERVVWSGFSWKRIIMPDHDNNSFSFIENEYWLKVIFLWANVKKKWKQKCADFLFFSLLCPHIDFCFLLFYWLKNIRSPSVSTLSFSFSLLCADMKTEILEPMKRKS